MNKLLIFLVSHKVKFIQNSGPDAVSIILQVAQNVFDAKLPGRLLHPDRSTEFSNRPINMTMGARCCHGALLT
ncbi:hypothetical protein GOP47_0024901 [Adiantum capillus-veneris]|uniref:Uncharacterized protein n=1 Tax=Adiantum capillus-veneris TaxID=13818 RepID=A0A9D4U598_ADICA|nr:hypothetical protein GOP47_0024901 [Adiantum capillus-veneris]